MVQSGLVRRQVGTIFVGSLFARTLFSLVINREVELRLDEDDAEFLDSCSGKIVVLQIAQNEFPIYCVSRKGGGGKGINAQGLNKQCK